MSTMPTHRQFRMKNLILGNFNKWEMTQVRRVQRLSDFQVLREIESIMCGRNYSWHSISQRLQDLLDRQQLFLEHFEPGNVAYEWNILCDEKVTWERYGGPSFVSADFNRACLTNLKIIPSQAGLGCRGRRFTSANFDFQDSFGVKLSIEDKQEDGQGQEFRASGVDSDWFYAEGPEYRIEYIHSRIEY